MPIDLSAVGSRRPGRAGRPGPRLAGRAPARPVAPGRPRRRPAGARPHPRRSGRHRAWYAELGESGLATPGWPAEYGGLGLAADAAAVITDELTRLRADRPADDFIGLALAGPTIIEWGSDEQKERFLRPLALGEHRWCQLFSEPGAGSDLASLRTRAVKDGDHWVVNGQKVWSSYSDRADFGLLMARTDPSQPKHRGISYFLLDMHAPGVEVRPLRQLNGHSEFGEVFFTDVVVPDADRLGPEGLGWSVAISTLMQERSGLSGRPGVGPGQADALAARARRTGAWDDPVLRDRIMQAFITERALQMATVRAFAALGQAEPGAEGSIRKLTHAQLEVTLGLLATEAEPGDAIAWDAAGRGRGRGGGRVPVRQDPEHRRRHQRDPAQHHRRAGPRPAPRPRPVRRHALRGAPA